MVRKIQVTFVDEYLRCPLFYRYRRELDLPYLGNSDEEMLLEAAKHAVGAWFNALGRGLDRKKAREKVGHTLSSLWSRAGGNTALLPLVHARIMAILMELDTIFDQKYDAPISGAMPISAAVDGSIFEDVIDGLYLKNDLNPTAKRADKILVVVQIVSNKLTLSPRTKIMRRAMIRHAINSAMKPNPYKIKLVTFSLPDGAKKWHDLEKYQYDKFLFLGRAIIRHLDASHYLPTADPHTCNTCTYNTICSNRFCEPNLSYQLVGRARNKLLAQGEPE